MPTERYFLTHPVEGGHDYYDVRDREGEYPNFSLVTIYKDTPGALEIAEFVLQQLQKSENHKGEKHEKFR